MSLFKTIRYKYITWQVWRVKRLLQRAEQLSNSLRHEDRYKAVDMARKAQHLVRRI